METNQAMRNNLKAQSLEEDELASPSPRGNVDLKAIREAIARVEAEAKATVAAENRNLHARSPAQEGSPSRDRVGL